MDRELSAFGAAESSCNRNIQMIPCRFPSGVEWFSSHEYFYNRYYEGNLDDHVSSYPGYAHGPWTTHIISYCRPASHRQNPNDTIIFLILSDPPIVHRCRFQYSVCTVHTCMIIQLLFGQRIGIRSLLLGQTSDILIWLINEQISPLNVRIRSLSIGLRQVFLYSSSHGNAMIILIVNASHVAKWGLFPDRL